MSYGFVAPVEQSNGNYGKFGLNQNAVLTKFDYVSSEQGEYIDFEFQVKDSTIKSRVYPITRCWVEGKEVSKEHEVFGQWEANLAAYVNHIALVYIDKTVLENSLKAVSDFKSFAQVVTSLVKASIKFVNKTPVDVFLEWQKTIRGSATQTYLEFATPEYGRYNPSICPAMGEGYKEVVATDGSLSYVKEDGTVHPLRRNAYFMTQTKKAKQQKLNVQNTVGDSPFETQQEESTDDLPF